MIVAFGLTICGGFSARIVIDNVRGRDGAASSHPGLSRDEHSLDIYCTGRR